LNLKWKIKLSKNIIKRIILHTQIESIIQYWYNKSSYKIKDFPGESFNINSIDEYNSFLFSTYFISSFSNQQQLYWIFNDIKFALVE